MSKCVATLLDNSDRLTYSSFRSAPRRQTCERGWRNQRAGIDRAVMPALAKRIFVTTVTSRMQARR